MVNNKICSSPYHDLISFVIASSKPQPVTAAHAYSDVGNSSWLDKCMHSRKIWQHVPDKLPLKSRYIITSVKITVSLGNYWQTVAENDMPQRQGKLQHSITTSKQEQIDMATTLNHWQTQQSVGRFGPVPTDSTGWHKPHTQQQHSDTCRGDMRYAIGHIARDSLAERCEHVFRHCNCGKWRTRASQPQRCLRPRCRRRHVPSNVVVQSPRKWNRHRGGRSPYTSTSQTAHASQK